MRGSPTPLRRRALPAACVFFCTLISMPAWAQQTEPPEPADDARRSPLFLDQQIAALAAPESVTDDQTGVTGTDEDDTLFGLPPLDVIANAAAMGADFPIFGSGDFDGSVTATATAGGVRALAGADTVGTTEPIAVAGNADATGVDVSGSLGGDASADVTVTVSADSVGADGGDDDDTLINAGPITTTAAADATAVDASLTLDAGLTSSAASGDALVEAGTRSDAVASAISGGSGADQIQNNGDLTANAVATTTTSATGLSIGVGVNADVAAGAALSDGSSVASASASGIDAGVGDDDVLSTGFMSVSSDSTATAITGGVSLAISDGGNVTSGGGVNDSSSIASSEATAIDGGAGNDTILALSAADPGIDLQADADATGVAVTLDIAGSVDGSASGDDALSAARTEAIASVTGLSGGSGNDQVTGAIDIEGQATSTATAVAAGISVAVSNEGDVTSGGAVSDASSLAVTNATGIDGGTGDDTIDSQPGATGSIDMTARSVATGVAASFDVGGSVQGNTAGGDAMSAARTDADATATGIAGGTGSDVISNSGEIGADSGAISTAVGVAGAVGVSVDGDVSAGAAVSDVSSRATTQATGIGGGIGDDTITSTTAGDFAITARAESESIGVAASFTVAGSVSGAADAGDALSEARTDASAAATGIAGDDGMDMVQSDSEINATAGSIATAVSAGFSVGIGNEGDVTAGAAVSDASSVATTRVVGIDGGADDDTIGGEEGITGGITSTATSEANGVAASFTVAGSAEGTAQAGDALSEARTDADAEAIGIAGGAGVDTVTSATAIDGMARSTSTAVAAGFSVGVTAEGDVTTGTAISDAASEATARAVGIDGGDGADAITSEAEGTDVISMLADANANGVAASFSVAGTASGGAESGDALSSARTDAVSTVAGIAGGAGGDTILSQTGISATADSDATAVSTSFAVSVSVEGDATAGSAISDSSSLANAQATGIDGGADGDTIGGEDGITGGVTVRADSTATGVSASFSVAGSAEGDAASGAALSETRSDAVAGATGIAGGGGDDIIRSATGIESDAVSTTVAVGVGISAEITKSGDSEGTVTGASALSDASSLAVARSTGIDGGDGVDEISSATAEGDVIDVYAESSSTSVAASIVVSGRMEGGIAGGGAVSEASTTADAQAVGIDSGDDGGSIDNQTAIDAASVATSTAIGAGVDVGITGDGNVESAALSDASSRAAASTTGIASGDGIDNITNTAELFTLADSSATGVAASVAVAGTGGGNVATQTVSDASVVAESRAAGIDSGDGADTIDNAGTINLMDAEDDADTEADAEAVSVAVSLDVSGSLDGDVSGDALSNASATASASATGIDGGGGVDDIDNSGRIASDVGAETTSVGVTIDVGVTADGDATGAALSDASAVAIAQAEGIDGGDGIDDIDNSGELDLRARSDAVGVSAAVSVAGTMEGNASSRAVSDASVTADSAVTGISGGAGGDIITNTGTIRLMDNEDDDAVATAVAVSLNVSGSLDGDVDGQALSDSSATANASGVGIDGGTGTDTIDNQADIFADVGAGVLGVAVAANVGFTLDGDATGAALSNTSAAAVASASGIFGGDDADDIDNLGNIDISTDAGSEAYAVSVSITGSLGGVAEGNAASDASATSIAQSTGIGGGEGDDDIDTTGEDVTADDFTIRTAAASDAAASAVTVQATAAIGAASGSAVADASATGESISTGIDGGAGDDDIFNESAIDATADANATANSTVVTASLALGSGDNVATGNSGATADATATGIDGGAGADEIINAATIFAGATEGSPMAEARAGSTTVTVGITIGEADNAASANASALAEANAAAIAGGSGGDRIDNTGTLMAGSATVPDESTGPLALALSSSETIDVGITLGDADSSATSNSSSTAVSDITGIDGGAGGDVIDNSGAITTFSSAEALGQSATTSVSLTLGSSEGQSTADAASRSMALGAGIDGGSDGDTITTDGTVAVDVRSLARTESSGLNLELFSIGASDQSAEANASATADAVARGVYGGAGGDTITVSGEYSVTADSSVASQAVARAFGGFSVGESVKQAQSRAETTADSLAVGIDGGAGDDNIVDAAVLNVESIANATATGVSSTNSGLNLAGSSTGESMSDASATVSAEGVGIRGGEMDSGSVDSDSDTITATAPLTVSAEATGSTQSSSTTDVVAIFGSADGSAAADASALVLARAVGIDGGADSDEITTSENEENETTGDIDVSATASASVTSDATTEGTVGFGDASTMGVSDASASIAAQAVGIDGGSGDDQINANQRVSVASETMGDVTSTSFADADVTFGSASSGTVADASVYVQAAATGIDGGLGADDISIGSLVDVSATSDGTVVSNSQSNADSTFGSASSSAISDASASRRVSTVGVDGGAGADEIEVGVAAELLAQSRSTGSVDTLSYANADAGLFGDASAGTATAASSEGAANAAGIIGGEDDDTIRNFGSLSADADATLTITSAAVSIADSTFGDAFAGAASDTSIAGRASATGITGDGGADEIETQGSLSVNAAALTDVRQVTVALADSTFGSANTVATSRNSSRGAVVAAGIEGGDGGDAITAGGQIAVAGASDVTVNSLTVSGSGPASSDAQTLATADVSGIDSGDGDDTITGVGQILVAAAPHVGVASRTYGNGGNVEGNVGIELRADASGMTAGDGQDTITIADDGSLVVVVGRQRDSTAMTSDDSMTDNVLIDAALIDTPAEDVVGKWLRVNLDDGPAFFTRIESFDRDSGAMTLTDPVPLASGVDTSYTLFDVDADGADIEASTVTVGGRVRVDAATEGNVVASGITGGDGSDTITNAGDVSVHGSNRTRAGSVTVARNIQADLSTASNVLTIGIAGDGPDAGLSGLMDGADTLSNTGDLSVEASSAIDFGAAQFSYFGSSDVDVGGTAQATAIGMRAGGMDDTLSSSGGLNVRSEASILAELRATAVFSEIRQQLEFAAAADATGLSAGDGDDTVAISGMAEIQGTAQASAIGSTSTQPVFNIFLGIFERRTENVIDVTLDGTSRGIDLGSGIDTADNTGTLNVQALAVPIDGDVVRAVSDANRNETGARATATNTAVAAGVRGASGDNSVINSGAIDVDAESVSTSFAQAANVLVADDQSRITTVDAPTRFTDEALAGTRQDFVLKELRFVGSDEGFTRLESSVTAVENGLAANQFEDDAAATGVDLDSVIGTRIRFTSSDPDVAAFESVVTGFQIVGPNNDQTAVFTLSDDLPADASGDPYRLSVLSATVTGFDPDTGEFELDENLPGDAAGSVYSLSLVSTDQTAGQNTFVDATRIGELAGQFENTWISFAGRDGFSGFVEEFFPDSGTFRLTSPIPFALSADDIYEISTTRNGTSGSTAIARAAGIDLGGGNAFVLNTGSIDVSANAVASTEVRASFGQKEASADTVAEAVGIRTRDGADDIGNADTASINVVATASATSTTDVRNAEVRAFGVDAGDGANEIANAGTIEVRAALLDAEDASLITDPDPSSVEAWGIRTGADADAVINSGTLLVTAETAESGIAADVDAFGIITGAGDDVVWITGTIETLIDDNGTLNSGTAIDTGDGNDELMLGGGSITVGSVTLGADDDLLALTGTPIIRDLDGTPFDVLAGDGLDRILISGTGSLLSTLLGFEEAVKVGDGEFALTTLAPMRYLQVDQGTLTIGSDYAFAADGDFDTVVYSDDSHGQLAVTGTAALAGSMAVERRGEDYIGDGTRYILITATDALAGEFADIELPEALPLLSFDVDQGPDTLSVVAAASSFNTVAENTLQQRVADNLDLAAGSASGDFGVAMGRLQTLPGGFDRALQSYTPDAHQVANEGSTKLIQQSTALLQSQLRSSRTQYRDEGPLLTSMTNVSMYYDSSGYASIGVGPASSMAAPGFADARFLAAAQSGASGMPVTRSARSQAWALGMVSKGDYDETGGYTGFEQDTGGFAAGYDFRGGEQVLLGLSAGKAETDLEMPEVFAEGAVDGWFANLYGTWFSSETYLEWGLGYNDQDIATARQIDTGTDTSSASSSHDGEAWSAFVGAGKLFAFERVTLEPYATIQSLHLSEDAFEETGAGSLDQIVESRNTSALFGEIGARLGERRPAGDGWVDWHLSLGWNYDFDIDDRRIDYTYRGAPGTILSIDGRDVSQSSALLGGSIAVGGERVGFSLEYRGRFNSDYQEQSGAAMFNVRF